MQYKRSSVIAKASWITPLLMSTFGISDGSKPTFFIAGSIDSITSLRNLSRVLKFFSELRWGILPDNTEYYRL